MGLALVVIEEHAGRTMHLRDDDALGAVDDGKVPFMVMSGYRPCRRPAPYVLDRLRAGFFVDIEHDQAQRHLQRAA